MYTLGIETFLTVVRSQNLSKAAKELNLAQTTVSQRLKVLEEEMGTTLIERGKGIKQIRLTPVGEEFFKLAEQWSVIWREIKFLQSQGPRLSLVVGSIDSLNTFLLPRVYRAINKHEPPIRLKIQTLHTLELYAAVENRQVDVGFVVRERIHPNVHIEKCFTSPMVILRPATAAESEARTIHPSELDPNQELLMPWGQLFENWHDHWCAPSPSRTTLDTIHLLLTLFQDPLQWAIVPMFIAKVALEQGNYSVYRLIDPPPDYTCYKLTHQNPRSLAQQGLDVFNRYFQSALQHKDYCMMKSN